MSRKILIGIGTYNRNKLLKRALIYISKLNIPIGCSMEVVISDNNPCQEAKEVYLNIKKEFPFLLHYLHEPAKSIASVRNAVLKKALDINAEYIVFIDDDEYPLPDWILELYKTMLEFEADGATSYPQIIDGDMVCDIPHNIKRGKMALLEKAVLQIAFYLKLML